MIIVSNTSPILNLACIDKLEILQKLYSKIYIPKAVYSELTESKDDLISKKVKNASWIVTKKISNQILFESLLFEIDKGESEAIVLSIELKSKYLLIDEIIGRYVASRLDLNYIGILGILLSAKKKNIITEIKPIIDDLINAANFWINKNIYNYTLEQAGES